MTRFSAFVITVAAVLFSASSAQAQSLTIRARSAVVGGNTLVYSTGDYTVGAGQTVDKIKSTWYKQVGMNLVYAGDVTVNNPAGGTYETGKIQVPLTDGAGNPISYTVINKLYVTGNANPVAEAVTTDFKP